MEYNEFAKMYDIFYQNKNYNKEVEFLKHFLNSKDNIVDIGCGTGKHASLLENEGFNVDGLDLSKDMLNIASTKVKGTLYNQDILDINIDKKYDSIISMFAVMNHLKNIEEFEIALNNLKNILKNNGTIIIDLHNPKDSGEKTDIFGNFKRTMKWFYDRDRKIETTEIIFNIDGKIYKDSHTFKIFTIDEVKNTCQKLGLNIKEVYENYNIGKEGTDTSKNLQFIIYKKGE